MNCEQYVKRTEELLGQIRQKINFEVLKVEFVKEDGNYYLRVYCNNDREGGIGAEDLAEITRPLNKLLDKEDFIEEAYTLEVCSPGYLEDVETVDDYDISQIEDQEDQENE